MEPASFSKQSGKISLWLAIPLALFGMLLIVYLLFANAILKSIAEDELSKANGAEVNINSLSHTLFPFGLELENLEITDNAAPHRNKLAIAQAKADVNFSALINSKLHIDELIVKEVAFGTPRQSPGFVMEQVPSQTFKFPSVEDLPSVDEVLENTPLKTTKAIAQAKSVYEKYEAPLKTQAEALPSKADIDAYKAQIRALQETDYKDPSKLLEAKAAFAKLKESIKADLANAKKLKETASQAKSELTTTGQLLKQAPVEDYDLLKGLITGEQAALAEVTQHLFGDKAQLYTQSLLVAIDMLKKSSQSEQKEIALDDSGLPNVWIKNATISINFANQVIQSDWSNITENHQLVGEATEFVMNSVSTQSKQKLSLQGSFEIIKGIVSASQNWDILGLALDSIELVPEEAKQSLTAILKSAVVNSTGTLNIIENELSGNSNFDLRELALDAQGQTKLTQSIASMLRNIGELNLATDFEGTLVSPNISVTSDLDKKIVKALSTSFSDNDNPALKELKAKLNAKVSDQLGSTASQIASVDTLLAAVNGDTAALNGLLNEQLNNVIEDKKSELLNKLKDKLFKP